MAGEDPFRWGTASNASPDRTSPIKTCFNKELETIQPIPKPPKLCPPT